MFKYFNNCKTAEDVKKIYRDLVKANHPDVHDPAEFDKYNKIMQEINAEYDKAFERYKNVHTTADDQTFTKDTAETPEEFRNIINGLAGCDGVIIDIVGSWVWLRGNTYEYKDKIRALGFIWARKKKVWCWHSPKDECISRGKKDLDQIKEKYGCTTIKADNKPKTLNLNFNPAF